ncbi:GntR family transcriptional regulator [Alicyclobacillus fastidiosus]|uniref:GntR family transcriptional regulator n=1 Tax=Alicyclobacillus fastidiosus TaxID=392011 RepID=A0ABY6ZKE2_9BACL|nr:GntR family transcriptional regulator [Alicyclobacillus fastidiosus]WAH42554.1 GntR family transcriptional regulator [Alicyclobacillus fastidiosus]GMA64404.1 GntR family transcriptional regulator [Alicyclobacillus fastidiosus]
MDRLIETSILTDQVYQVLRKEIIGGKFAPGTKLDINALASDFKVSRSPVKDAITQLVHDGLIEILPRKGTYVTQLKREDFIELLDVRLMVESWAASKAMAAISDRDLENWHHALVQMDSLVEQKPFPFEQYAEYDITFHRLLVQYAGNSRCLKLYDSLNAPVALARVVYHYSYESSIRRHDDHKRMYEALQHKNLPALLTALEQHIRSIQEEAAERWSQVFPSTDGTER